MTAAEDDAASSRELKRGQDRIEAAVGALAQTVSELKDGLAQRFVPRDELNTTFNAIRDHQLQQDGRLVGLETGRDTDRTALVTRMERVEERHRTDRFNAKLITLGELTLIVAILTLVIAHWK